MTFRVLIVEDDVEKLRCMTAAICDGGVDVDAITHVVDLHSAKVKMSENMFELLVLDISLPTRIDQEIRHEGGLDLLQELLERDGLQMPAGIVGITGFEDAESRGRERFPAVPIVRYEVESDRWAGVLKGMIQQLARAKASKDAAEPAFGSDMAIVCALEDPELAAVLKNGWDWRAERVAGDSTSYFRADVLVEGRKRTVICASATRMGMPATAVLATKMIHAFRPKILAMTGITAGVKGRGNLGDVIVADPSWDWGNGKWTSEDGEPRFMAAPHQLPLEQEMRRRALKLARDEAALARIRSAWPGEKPDHVLALRVGPLASGAAVLADGQSIARIVEQHREVLGVEMEAYGIFAAAAEVGAPRPAALVIKSVVDFGNRRKSDEFQRYSAFVSSEVLKLVFEDSA